MKRFRLLAAPIFALICLTGTGARSAAQVSINVQIGPEPVCPYGYFNYAPYRCAPFGYYGPQWFTSGIFLGAGPWFQGPVGFHGYINHDYDPRFGYHGPFPARGEHADWGRHRGWENHFRGNEYRDEVRHDNGNHYGQYKDHGDHGNGRGHDRGEHHDNGHGHDRD